MENRFAISSINSGKRNLIFITDEEFQNIIDSKEKLIKVLFVEEKFDLLIENYFEFEKELTNITFSKMLFQNHVSDWSVSVSDIHLVNRRLINLLTTSRLYFDQIAHDISSFV